MRANLLAAESAAPGEAYNVCTGKEISIMDLLEELSQVSQTNPEVHYEAARPGDIYRSVGDPGKAAAQFGFRAQKILCRRAPGYAALDEEPLKYPMV